MNLKNQFVQYCFDRLYNVFFECLCNSLTIKWLAICRLLSCKTWPFTR